MTGFTPATELLSDVGWVRVDVLHERARSGLAIRIAQYLPDTEAIEFVEPIVRESPYVGPLIRLRTDKKIELVLQPEHRCLLRSLHGYLRLVPAREYGARSHQLHGGNYTGGQQHLSPEQVAWLCAVQADGTFRAKSTIVFNFSKARKCDRLRAVMDQLGIHYTEHEYQYGVSKPFRNFHISPTKNEAVLDWTLKLLTRAKIFGPWLLDLDRATLDDFADEVTIWDGKASTRDRFYSVEQCNVDWVQILWTLSDRRSRVRCYPAVKENCRPQHHVYQSAGRPPYSTTSNLTREEFSYAGPLYPVTTPSGFVLMRIDGKASITGDGSPGTFGRRMVAAGALTGR